jgi:chromosome segregation ATPase
MDLDKLNIQGMLDKFKHTKDELGSTFRDIFTLDDDEEDDFPEPKQEPVIPKERKSAPKEQTEEANTSHIEQPSEAPNTQDIDIPVAPTEKKAETQSIGANLKDGESDKKLDILGGGLTDVQNQLTRIKMDISELTNANSDLSDENSRTHKILEGVNGKLNTIDEKLNDMSNSLASVYKLNDSIFDLKNSQMNTKNSLSDLQSEFYRLKRKMSFGVMLISILSAIIAVLEVLNLLS